MEVLNFNDKKYSARTFRKSFISLCRSKYNMDASVVMELVGHEHLNTTDRYYNKISFDVMRQELKKYVIPVVREKKKEIESKTLWQTLWQKYLSLLYKISYGK